MAVRVTERSLYTPIIGLFEEVAKRYGVKVSGVQEVNTGGRYPDVLIQMDGRRILVQVKIDRVSKLIEDVVKSYPIARKFNADLIGILFPSEVRRVVPTELSLVAPKLRVTRALVLTEWMSTDLENVELSRIVESIVKEFIEYKRKLIPAVNYLTIAKVAREAIEELGGALRKYMGIKKYFGLAQAIIGRFDFYKSLLEELIEKEEVMKTYIADIIAYLVVLQLLFGHIVSVKKYKRDVLPAIESPLSIPETLFIDIKKNIQSLGIHEEYKGVIGSLPYLLDVLKEISSQDRGVLVALGRYIYAIKVLRPEHVKEELLGRIYQEGLPPETRKNLGAFFTNPKAAKLLAELAIDRWDEKVLDPACGSGTLLVASYWTKMKRAKEQGVGMDSNTLHRIFIKDHIVGIDVMQFAKELTTINLAFQNIRVTDVVPRVYYGDGIEKMVQSVEVNDDPPPSRLLTEYVKLAMKEYEKLVLPREGFDVVIMNPPFTRRERIPAKERSKLGRIFGSIISGKVGYWAYFFVAADNVIKPYGKLATVAPEEFFAGRSAESLRRYMLLGERAKYRYRLKYVVKSIAEVAFSEGALYRDYLVVLEKRPPTSREPSKDYMLFIVLKKRKDELKDEDIEKIASIIREMDKPMARQRVYSSSLVDVIKVENIDTYIEKHISNLKPLVGFNCLATQKIFFNFLSSTAKYPTLGEIAELTIYNPGQYSARGGVEDYARRLFIAKYGARGKVTFRFVGETANEVQVRVKSRGIEHAMAIDKRYLKPSLRTLSGVKHMNITGETEYVIVDINALKPGQWATAGLTDTFKLRKAIQDVKDAYRDKASRLLIARRCGLTSPNIYWLAFYSDTPILFTTSPFVALKLRGYEEDIWYKILALYLNSTITYLQILGYFVETIGAWGTLHAELVWSNIVVPDFDKMGSEDLKYALQVFDKVSKVNAKSLYERISHRDPIQRLIDKATLRLLGLHGWVDRLDDLYRAVKCELDTLQKIFEESRKRTHRRHSRETEPDKEEIDTLKYTNTTLTLDKWLKPKQHFSF